MRKLTATITEEHGVKVGEVIFGRQGTFVGWTEWLVTADIDLGPSIRHQSFMIRVPANLNSIGLLNEVLEILCKDDGDILEGEIVDGAHRYQADPPALGG